LVRLEDSSSKETPITMVASFKEADKTTRGNSKWFKEVARVAASIE
jgi:hypothetical protein